MGQSDYSHYNTQPMGSPAPVIWYASLPQVVKELYEHRNKFSDNPPLMVILAEVVCEAFTVWALEELFKKKKVQDLWKVLSGRGKRRYQDICDGRVHKIYTALSGDQITKAPFWTKLTAHNNRRNALVHPDHAASGAAAIPSKPEADESFQAVEQYSNHVLGILNAM